MPPSFIIWSKLRNYGFEINALSLLENYFSNRSQLTKLDFTLSNPCKMSLGVPQGSILGPLFFSIFINDLPFALNLHPKLFADDTTLYKTFDLKNNSFDDGSLRMICRPSFTGVNITDLMLIGSKLF